MQVMTAAPAATYWAGLARAYALLGQPLKPSGEDLRLMERAVSAVEAPGGLRALLLGVTPGVAAMRWPAGSSLLALDASLPMVQGVWPRNLDGRRRAVCGDWRALPCGPGSREAVVGDGSINCLPYPEGYRALAGAVWEVLSEGGIFVLRCYLQPGERESAEQVVADLPAIPSFHHYKFRLLMALQRTVRQGIAVDEVYRFWAGRHPGGRGVPSGPGWEPAVVETIELYRGTQTVHTFPTLAELRGVLGERFDEIGLSTPSYPLGERCPTLIWTPRRG